MVINFDMSTGEVEYLDGPSDDGQKTGFERPSRDPRDEPRLELRLMTVAEAVAAERRR